MTLLHHTIVVRDLDAGSKAQTRLPNDTPIDFIFCRFINDIKATSLDKLKLSGFQTNKFTLYTTLTCLPHDICSASLMGNSLSTYCMSQMFVSLNASDLCATPSISPHIIQF